VNEPSGGGLEAMILQLIPLMLLQGLYAYGAFFILKKRGVNPWPWTLATLVPFVGFFAPPFFIYTMLAALFDRLRDLEAQADKE